MTRTALTLTLILAIAACTAESVPLVANDVSIRGPMPGMQMAAGYLTLTNNTPQSIIITRVSSPQFEAVEMHESVLEDGVSRMYALGSLTVPPHRSVRFEPGGKHLMLMRPVADVEQVTLEFYAGEAVMLRIDTRLGE